MHRVPEYKGCEIVMAKFLLFENRVSVLIRLVEAESEEAIVEFNDYAEIASEVSHDDRSGLRVVELGKEHEALWKLLPYAFDPVRQSEISVQAAVAVINGE